MQLQKYCIPGVFLSCATENYMISAGSEFHYERVTFSITCFLSAAPVTMLWEGLFLCFSSGMAGVQPCSQGQLYAEVCGSVQMWMILVCRSLQSLVWCLERTTDSPAANFYYQQLIAYRTWLSQTADMMINAAICLLYVKSQHAGITKASDWVVLLINSFVIKEKSTKRLLDCFVSFLCPFHFYHWEAFQTERHSSWEVGRVILKLHEKATGLSQFHHHMYNKSFD